jgi:hypothetical protein
MHTDGGPTDRTVSPSDKIATCELSTWTSGKGVGSPAHLYISSAFDRRRHSRQYDGTLKCSHATPRFEHARQARRLNRAAALSSLDLAEDDACCAEASASKAVDRSV